MTDQSKLKRAARTRAKKTGESYASARRQVTNKLDRERSNASRKAAALARGGHATGSVTEARCIEKTGHGFDHWFAILDRFGAVKNGHTAAARHLGEEHGVSAWYCQAITVAFERARGIRELNQVCQGDYQVSVSRVLPVSLDRAVASLGRKTARERWLPRAAPIGSEVAKALVGKRVTHTPNASRMAFDGSGGRVELRITPKDDGRCTLVATVTKLTDQEAVAEARSGWRQTLDAFRAHLSRETD